MTQSKWTLAAVVVLAGIFPSYAVTNIMYGGAFTDWPTTWNPLLSLNDPDDSLSTERLDIVGDNSDPAVYVAADENFFFLRLRIDDGAPGSNLWGSSTMIMIDNTGSGTPTNAIAWDYKENQQQNHGLELMTPYVIGNSWGASRFNDVDNNNAQKISPPDFALSLSEGYIRTIENVSTVNFGTSTYIDFAASWTRLGDSTTLALEQTWRIQVGTIDNANDHNWINGDVAAGFNPDDTPLSWSDPFVVSAIPEPSVLALMVAAGLGLAAAKKRRSC